jgi:hypothetical protein
MILEKVFSQGWRGGLLATLVVRCSIYYKRVFGEYFFYEPRLTPGFADHSYFYEARGVSVVVRQAPRRRLLAPS